MSSDYWDKAHERKFRQRLINSGVPQKYIQAPLTKAQSDLFKECQRQSGVSCCFLIIGPESSDTDLFLSKLTISYAQKNYSVFMSVASELNGLQDLPSSRVYTLTKIDKLSNYEAVKVRSHIYSLIHREKILIMEAESIEALAATYDKGFVNYLQTHVAIVNLQDNQEGADSAIR